MVAEYSDATVRDATPKDAKELLENIRPEDLQEIRALRSGDLQAALEMGISLSEPCYAASTESGDLALVFGVVPHPTEKATGVVWLLGTHHMESIHYRFLRESRVWLERLYGDKYEILFNIADKRNTLHLTWLKWLGFKFMQEVEAGLNGELFIEFLRTKDV